MAPKISTNDRRRWLPLVMAMCFALLLTITIIRLSRAARISDWGATEFQVQNLDSIPARFTAHFYDEAGFEVLVFSDTIAPMSSVYFKPEEESGLDPAFVGTMAIESNQPLAGAVMHFMTTTITGFNGNDVFQMTPDTITTTLYHIPRIERGIPPDGFSTKILISNLGTETAQVEVTLRDSNGAPVDVIHLPVDVRGSQRVDLSGMESLVYGFAGWATVHSDQPIRVEVLRSNQNQWATYTAPSSDGIELVVPRIHQLDQDVVTPTFDVLNARSIDVDVFICLTKEPTCVNFPLKAFQSVRITPEIYDDGPYMIHSTGPIFAIIGLESSWGSWAYAATPQDQAATHLAAPMLFDNYQGWSTTLYIFNTAGSTTTVSVQYDEAAARGTMPLVDKVGPRHVIAFGPVLGAEHYAAWIEADGPVLGIIEGVHKDAKDGAFIYWADAYTPREHIYLPLVLSNAGAGSTR
ncbi:MAG: hypothetical protein JXA42_05880 [Anaerolineales bacterium]|nr:hypothetical protein [Anaerolineales bacterium]